MIRRRLVLAAIALVVGACSVGPGTAIGPSPSPSPAASPSRSPAASPSPTLVASPSPSATPVDSSVASPSASASSTPGPTLSADDVPHEFPDLEAVLPAAIGDVGLLRMSQPGSLYAGGGDMCGFVCPFEPQLMAEGVGAAVEDVALAFAFDGVVDRYILTAWRIDGATGAELRRARIDMDEHAEAPYPIVDEVPVGDDTVTVVMRSWVPSQTEYLVTRDEALILIRTADSLGGTSNEPLPADMAEVVAAIP